MDTLAHPIQGVPIAEAGARRIFTADEFEAMVRAGIINEAERLELIGGEIVSMPSKGIRHEIVRNKLQSYWVRKSVTTEAWSEAPVRLAKTDQPEPDIVVYPATIPCAKLTGPDVLVIVEVSDSSVSYDLKIKAPVYAANGVREYWVIDANRLVTHIHRDLTDGTYRTVSAHAFDQTLTPQAAPGLAVCLDDLGLDWEA
jgi:Uma2 family endonuclease